MPEENTQAIPESPICALQFFRRENVTIVMHDTLDGLLRRYSTVVEAPVPGAVDPAGRQITANGEIMFEAESIEDAFDKIPQLRTDFAIQVRKQAAQAILRQPPPKNFDPKKNGFQNRIIT